MFNAGLAEAETIGACQKLAGTSVWPKIHLINIEARRGTQPRQQRRTCCLARRVSR